MFHFSANNLVRKGSGPECARSNNPKDWKAITPKKIHIEKRMEIRQCECVNPDSGHRCQRFTRKQLPYCWQHTMLVQHLVIKQSKLKGAGLGLFACGKPGEIVFRKGDTVALYARRARGRRRAIGEFLSEDELTKRYGECPTAAYAVKLKRSGDSVDTALQRSIGSYANGSASESTANAEGEKMGSDLWLVAKRNIRAGDEITWYYGSNYRLGDPKPLQSRLYHTQRSNTNQKCRPKKRD